MTLFFDQFQSFIEQLIVVFPEDPDFPSYLANLKMAKLTNPKMVIAGIEQH